MHPGPRRTNRPGPRKKGYEKALSLSLLKKKNVPSGNAKKREVNKKRGKSLSVRHSRQITVYSNVPEASALPSRETTRKNQAQRRVPPATLCREIRGRPSTTPIL